MPVYVRPGLILSPVGKGSFTAQQQIVKWVRELKSDLHHYRQQMVVETERISLSLHTLVGIQYEYEDQVLWWGWYPSGGCHGLPPQRRQLNKYAFH